MVNNGTASQTLTKLKIVQDIYLTQIIIFLLNSIKRRKKFRVELQIKKNVIKFCVGLIHIY